MASERFRQIRSLDELTIILNKDVRSGETVVHIEGFVTRDEPRQYGWYVWIDTARHDTAGQIVQDKDEPK